MTQVKKNILKFASCVVLTFIAYLPMLTWMYDRWTEAETFYGHGFLIPLVSLFIIWQRCDALRRARDEGRGTKGNNIGLWVVGCGLCMHVLAAALKVYFISGFSFVFVLYGLVLFFFGKEMVRNLIFPIFFLLAMIPLPLVLMGALTVRLKLFVAQIATLILNLIGFPSFLDGSTIRMPKSFIVIEAPCSGLRSIISLLTLGLIFAYAIKASFLKKVVLFLSSIPIAIVTNIFRVLMLAIVNDLYGEKVAMGFFHDSLGFVVFALAFVSLLAVGRALEGAKND